VALSDGIYRIKEIEAVFPDGLIFSFFPERNKELKSLEIDITAFMKEEENEFTIFLVIAESSDDVSPILGNPARYYSVEGDYVSDDNIKENTVRIPRLFPNAFLHIGETIPEFCIGFPLCKIIRIDGVFHVKNWTPPCFFIERHFPLWERCEKLTKLIREKAVFLSEKLQNSTSANTAFGSRRILEQIITIMPGLETLVYSNEIRPYELYQELSEVLGAVSVLIPTDIIPVMQPYNHNNIDNCLYTVINLIDHYLSVIERGFSVVSFNKKGIFFYRYISLDELEKMTSGCLYIGIRTDVNVDISGIEKWMAESIIVSDSALDSVRTKRVKGANRKLVEQEVVSRILPGIGVTLFEVDLDNNFIKGEENLHIFNPGNHTDIYPSEVTLYIPKEKR